MDFSEETTPDDVVTVVATRPPTRDEERTDLPQGGLLALRDGGLKALAEGARRG